jgi:orotidine-5'-phosphate decarboxylase
MTQARTNKIILALDTNDLNFAIDVAKKIKNKIFTIKLGLEFFNAHGKSGIKKFNDLGFNNIMLDLKLNDIGNTCFKAIKSLNGINFEYLTIHALGGKEMILKCKEAANEINHNIKILAVTILTSLNYKDINLMGMNNNINDLVLQLAKNSSDAHGYVCSGNEALALRKIIGKEKIIFCPGIRMPEEDKNDQQRIMSPKQALNNGADKIIMGRSLLSGDIKKNIEKVINSLN